MVLLIVFGLIAFVLGIAASRSGNQLSGFGKLFRLGGVALMVIGSLLSTVRQINLGTVGVQVLFGKVQEQVLSEGLSFVNPLVSVKDVSVQTQNYTMSGVHNEGQVNGDDAIRALSSDGLEISLDLTVLYRVLPTEAPRIVREIGMDFQDKVVRPITRTRIREAAVYYLATDLYTAKREDFEARIRANIEKDFKERGFVLEQLLVRNISLPTSVRESIERKINAEQDAQRMEFVLDKGRREAELRRVEAQGVADAQKILSEGLSEKVLQYEMIKVQKELATSPNSKVIIMGNGKGSAPILLGQ